MASVHEIQDEALPPTTAARALRWLVWLTFVVGWTAALLTPEPASFAQDILPEATLAPSFKSAHLLCYAVMMVLTAWLQPGVRWPHIAFVSGHAFLTEFFQQFVPGRTASLMDVGIDHLGILLGLIALRVLK